MLFFVFDVAVFDVQLHEGVEQAFETKMVAEGAQVLSDSRTLVPFCSRLPCSERACLHIEQPPHGGACTLGEAFYRKTCTPTHDKSSDADLTPTSSVA